MEGFLQVTETSSTIPSSPSNSFIADEVASICPLITPSPPTNDLINSLPESGETNFAIIHGEELATILQKVKDDDKCAGDSASSSSSALAEPSCTQLLNHRNTYHHIAKDEHTAAEETAGKVQPLQLTFRNPPENYFFISWNWPLIRKISLITFLTALMAMVAIVIAMISTLPRTCNPQTEWYQGSVMYEIFPASFYDSNNDMIGDFKGLSQNLDYIKSLGVSAVRLNSIFKTQHYPEDYRNVTTLIEIAPALGNLNDFLMLVERIHTRNLSIILDLPVFPVVKHLSLGKTPFDVSNSSSLEPSVEFLRAYDDPIGDSLMYWSNNGVDGFYLKGLQHFADDPNLAKSLRRWKRIVGQFRPLIVHENLINSCPSNMINIVLNNVDLVDVRLEIEQGVANVSQQIDSIQNGTLFSRPGLPWIHWSLGDETTSRLANLLPYGNATLGATLLQLMLPGTPSIFYGNEIGLQEISDPEGDRKDLVHLHQLAAMSLPNKHKEVLSWMHGEKTHVNFDQLEMVSKMAELRAKSPSIYLNSVYKEGDNRANADVKYSRSDLLVIQRWYPRRKSYVVAINLGSSKISADLSTLLYSGMIVIGPKADSKPGSVSFKDISLWPGEAVVIQLD